VNQDKEHVVITESGQEIRGAKIYVRLLWRAIPAPVRHWLYRTGTTTARESNHAVFRAFRRIRNMFRNATLYTPRWHAVGMWPDIRPRSLDNWAAAIWMAGLRHHDAMLDAAWRWGHLLRRRRPRPVDDAHRRRVAHVTGSFDLGGTQTQIKFLCTAADAAFEHQAIEIFPEMNYLYRQGVQIDPARYVTGSVIGRTFGRMVTNINFRSSQIVQIYKLVRDFEAERPAVVVGWGHEMSVTAFIAAAIARVPRIVFCVRTVNPTYGWVPQHWGTMLLRAHKNMLPSVSLVAVNSTLLRDDHAQWVGMDPSAIAVCANGIDIQRLSPAEAAAARARIRAELGIADDVAVITNVGRFSGEKGQHSLVYANRLLLARGVARQFVWILCGDGPTLAEVQGLAAGFGITNMHFLGRTTAVREILCASDIFVMPSDFEGMPNAMLEAMSAGLPCVSTQRSGALDVARDGIEAFYYEARDAVTLARHLLRLLEHPDQARRMGEAAARRVTEFPIDRFVRAFEGALDGVVATPPPDRS
jgi:glycosyltransferase involved in cell wall biosynthesis